MKMTDLNFEEFALNSFYSREENNTVTAAVDLFMCVSFNEASWALLIWNKVFFKKLFWKFQ